MSGRDGDLGGRPLLSRRGRMALAGLGLFTLVMTALVVYTFAAGLH